MYEQFSKEQLAEQVNKARRIAINFAAKIYEYESGDISKSDLVDTVKNYLSPEVEQMLYHKIIAKDYFDIDDISNDVSKESEIEEVNECLLDNLI